MNLTKSRCHKTETQEPWKIHSSLSYKVLFPEGGVPNQIITRR